jgi:hypothetical protein
MAYLNTVSYPPWTHGAHVLVQKVPSDDDKGAPSLLYLGMSQEQLSNLLAFLQADLTAVCSTFAAPLACKAQVVLQGPVDLVAAQKPLMRLAFDSGVRAMLEQQQKPVSSMFWTALTAVDRNAPMESCLAAAARLPTQPVQMGMVQMVQDYLCGSPPPSGTAGDYKLAFSQDPLDLESGMLLLCLLSDPPDPELHMHAFSREWDGKVARFGSWAIGRVPPNQPSQLAMNSTVQLQLLPLKQDLTPKQPRQRDYYTLERDQGNILACVHPGTTWQQTWQHMKRFPREWAGTG